MTNFFELSLEVMETLKKTTDYKYVVTATARKVRNEVSDLIYPGDHFLPEERVGSLYCRV